MPTSAYRVHPAVDPAADAEILRAFLRGLQADPAAGRGPAAGAAGAVRVLLAGVRPGPEEAGLVGRLAHLVLGAAGDDALAAAAQALAAVGASSRPRWDAAAHRLWWGGAVVKRLRHDAANVAAVLDAFEALGWPLCVPDPLPRCAGLDPKARRRETVRGLNSRLPARTIRFFSDGSGDGFRWAAVG